MKTDRPTLCRTIGTVFVVAFLLAPLVGCARNGGVVKADPKRSKSGTVQPDPKQEPGEKDSNAPKDSEPAR